MLESAGNSKPRDALLQKLRERIKERDKALEVELKHTYAYTFTYQPGNRNSCQPGGKSDLIQKCSLY